MKGNELRQHNGMDAIERYAKDDDLSDRDILREAAVDLMSDVLHALHRWGWDAESAHAMAWRHFVAERDEATNDA